MSRSNISLAALLLISGTRSLAMKTDFDNDSGLLKICSIDDGNDTNEAGGQDIGTVSGGGVNDGNDTNEAGSERQQDQSNDNAPQANSTATETAAGNPDTSETGSQDTGGERQPE